MTEIVSTSLLLNRTETSSHVSFWHYVAEHLTKHEYERYLLLKQVCFLFTEKQMLYNFQLDCIFTKLCNYFARYGLILDEVEPGSDHL